MWSLALLLLGCGPQGAPCVSGVREAWSARVDTPGGAVEVETTQCVSVQWSYAPCDDGPALCTWFFEPYTPAEVPLELIYGDLVFRQAVGHRDVDPPVVAAGRSDLEAALKAERTARLAEGGYATTPVRTTQRFGMPAHELSVTCDHPDTDPICPFTWTWVLVDLDALEPGLYADLSAMAAEDLPVDEAGADLPESWHEYREMIDGIELLVDP